MVHAQPVLAERYRLSLVIGSLRTVPPEGRRTDSQTKPRRQTVRGRFEVEVSGLTEAIRCESLDAHDQSRTRHHERTGGCARLMHRLNRRPPAEVETKYYA